VTYAVLPAGRSGRSVASRPQCDLSPAVRAKMLRTLKSESYANLCDTMQRVPWLAYHGSRHHQQWMGHAPRRFRRHFHSVSAMFNVSIEATIVCQTDLLPLVRTVAAMVGRIVEYGRKVEMRTEMSNFIAVRDQPIHSRRVPRPSHLRWEVTPSKPVRLAVEPNRLKETVSFVQFQVADLPPLPSTTAQCHSMTGTTYAPEISCETSMVFPSRYMRKYTTLVKGARQSVAIARPTRGLIRWGFMKSFKRNDMFVEPVSAPMVNVTTRLVLSHLPDSEIGLTEGGTAHIGK
jgi:hypothetical protein